ncbi:secretory pathway protein Sec39-domain-containing protein [Obelidium mucronatum]|nr:secretory pathway protein Sec39-domain-containing protein [Obelidium mucronatum]
MSFDVVHLQTPPGDGKDAAFDGAGVATGLTAAARVFLSAAAAGGRRFRRLAADGAGARVAAARGLRLELFARASLGAPTHAVPLPPPPAAPVAMAWSGNSALLAVAFSDGSIRIVSCEGLPVFCVEVEDGAAAEKPFDPPVGLLFLSSSVIAVVSHNAGIRLFNIPPPDVLEQVLQGTSQPTTPNASAFWRQSLVRVNSRGNVLNCHDSLAGFALYSNNTWLRSAVFLGSLFRVVSSVSYDPVTCRLIVAGVGSKGNSSPLVLFSVTETAPYIHGNGVEDVTAYAKEMDLISSAPSYFDTLVDMVTDLGFTQFQSARDTAIQTYQKTISGIREYGSKLLTFDGAGSLSIWELKETLLLLHQYPSSDLASYRSAHNAPSTAKTCILVDAEWWSSDSIVLSFNDGLLMIVTLPISPQTPPLFARTSLSYFQLSIWRNQQLFLLETNEVMNIPQSQPPSQSIQGLIETRELLNQATGSGRNEANLLTILHHPSPLSSVRLRVALGDYETAFQICVANNLPQDIIHKHMYQSSISSPAKGKGANTNITDILKKVQDTTWILKECFDPRKKDAREIRSGLEEVLRRSEEVKLEDVEREVEAMFGGGSSSESEAGSKRLNTGSDEGGKVVSKIDLCLARARAFKELDLLTTLEAIQETGAVPIDGVSAGIEFGELFMMFREADLLYLACWHASQGHLKAVEVLMTRHWSEAWGHRFFVASHFPLMMDCWDSSLKKLLPRCDKNGLEIVWMSSKPWRRNLDWTETTTSVQDLVKEFTEGAKKLADVTPPISWPAPSTYVRDWYIGRALQIEGELFDSKLAASLLNLAMEEFNVVGLESVTSELQTLNDLANELGDDKVGKITLNDLRNMPANDVVQMMLDPVKSNPQMFCNRLKSAVIPFLNRSNSDDIDGILDVYLVNLSAKHIETVVTVFEHSSSSSKQVDRVLNRSNTALSDLILTCAYRIPSSDSALSVLNRLMKCIPPFTASSADDIPTESDGWDTEFEFEPSQHAQVETTNLESRVSLFETQLETLELLQRHNVPVTLEYLVSPEFETKNAKRLLCVKMGRSLMAEQHDGIGASDEKWVSLYQDLGYLLTLKLFADVGGEDIVKEFFKVILQEERFSLAKRLMGGSEGQSLFINQETIHDLVVDCAKELYDNADVGDMRRGYLKMAVECLKIIPTTPTIQTEMSLIEATHQIHRLCSTLSIQAPLPIQIRLNTNRMDIVSSLVYGCTSTKSLDVKVFLEIARKLHGIDGLSPKQRQIDMSVRGIIANWALDRHDAKFAIKICEEMMAAVLSEQSRNGKQDTVALTRSDESWLTCVRILREVGDELDADFQKRVVGFVLERCEPGGMLEILDLLRAGDIARPLGHGSDLSSLNYSDCVNFVHGMLTELPGTSSATELSGGRDNVLPKHDFFCKTALEMSSHDMYPFHGTVQKLSEKRTLTELYFNISFVQGCKSAFERRRGGSIGVNAGGFEDDSLLLTLAQEYFRAGDIEIALLVLLDIQDDSFLQDFFNSLKPNRINDLLAVYMYSLRVFLFLVPAAERWDALPGLLDVVPVDLIKAIDSDVIREKVYASGEDSPSFLALQAAVMYSSRTKSSHSNKVIELIISATNCDEALFQSDESYRKEVLLSIAKKFNESSLLNDVLAACDGLGVPSSLLALEHICWLFSAKNVSTEVIRHSLTEFGDLLGEDEIGKLCGMKTAVVASENGPKIALFYSYLGHRFSQQSEIAEQLNARNTMIQLMASNHSGIFLESITLDQVISHNYVGNELLVEFYQAILANNISLAAFLDISQLLPRMRYLTFLSIFPDEHYFLQDKHVNTMDIKEILTYLSDPLIEQKLEIIEFEDQDESVTYSDFSEVSALMDFISVDKIPRIQEIYLVGPEAVFAPIELRQKLAIKCKQRLANNAEFDPVVRHLQLIEDLHRIEDKSNNETVPFERIHQFDAAFLEFNENIILCMKMVISGASPSIINKVCQLLETRFPETVDFFNVMQIYRDAVLAVVGAPRLDFHEKAFKRIVESPSDALDRLFQAAVGSISPDEVSAISGKDDAGWDDDLDFDDGTDFAKSLFVDLRDTTVGIIALHRDSISADVRLSLISLVKKYFGYEEIPVEDIQTAKVESITRNIWGVEIQDEETKDAALFIPLFQKLLAISKTTEHCEGLIVLLESLNNGFLPKDLFTQCQVDILMKAAENKHFDLLMTLRFKTFGELEIETEKRLLKYLASQSSPESTLEWVKHSLLCLDHDVASSSLPALLDLASMADDSTTNIAKDQILHFLILGNGFGCKLSRTKIWPHIVQSIAQRRSAFNAKFSAIYESIITSVILDLIINESKLAAFLVVVAVFDLPQNLLGTPGAVHAVLKGYLRRVGGGHGSAVVFSDESTNGFLPETSVLEHEFVKVLEKVDKIRSAESSCSEKVLAALTKL